MVRKCRVTLSDIDGINHNVEVTAASLYEAIALGLSVLRTQDWAAELTQGSATVSVQNLPVEHRVSLREFNQWLERKSKKPAEETRRGRARQILGLTQ